MVHDDGLGLFLLATREGREAGPVIGFGGLRFTSDGVGPRDSELYYGLSRDWHGQGLMSEAATALLDYNRGRSDFGPCFAAYWICSTPFPGVCRSNLASYRQGGVSSSSIWGRRRGAAGTACQGDRFCSGRGGAWRGSGRSGHCEDASRNGGSGLTVLKPLALGELVRSSIAHCRVCCLKIGRCR